MAYISISKKLGLILHLGKQRANFFKFLLNADWLREVFSRKNSIIMADRVYSSVEYEYQRDGHYWLQRGLFYRARRIYNVARDYLEKSIEAYPGNEFARHALAQQKLIGASLVSKPTPILERDVAEAVEELLLQAERRGASSEYPLVTLAQLHPEVLMKWGIVDGAKASAREYFERLNVQRRSLPKADKAVDAAWERCMKLATTGRWKPSRY